MGEIFGQPDITDDASETGDEPGRLDSPDGVDRAVRVRLSRSYVPAWSGFHVPGSNVELGTWNMER